MKWSPRSLLAGKFPAQLLSTGEEFLSVSPWRYDRRESDAERCRLREEGLSEAAVWVSVRRRAEREKHL